MGAGIREERAFTLVELLVVVAIIGLLSAIVFANVSSARNKGGDAAIQAQLHMARNQAEVYATNNGQSYLGVCSAAQSAGGMGGLSGSGMLATLASTTNATIVSSSGPTLAVGAGTKVTCNDAATSWTIEAPFTDSTDAAPHMWCADSTGAVGAKNTVNAGTTSCS